MCLNLVFALLVVRMDDRMKSLLDHIYNTRHITSDLLIPTNKQLFISKFSIKNG